MPRKAEHLSFQGKKRFWKSEHGLRSYVFHFCAVTLILSMRSPLWKNVEKGEISKNAKIDDAILLITPLFLNRFSNLFSSESCHAKLLEEKRIFEIDSETWELWLKNVCARTKSEYLHKKWNNSLTHAPIFKIFFSLESWDVQLSEACCVSSLSFLEPEILAHKMM